MFIIKLICLFSVFLRSISDISVLFCSFVVRVFFVICSVCVCALKSLFAVMFADVNSNESTCSLKISRF